MADHITGLIEYGDKKMPRRWALANAALVLAAALCLECRVEGDVWRFLT